MQSQQMFNDCIARAAGGESHVGRAPVVLALPSLEGLFGSQMTPPAL